MKVKSESEVAQSCLTLRNPMDCNPPGSSIHGIFYGEEKVKSENCNHFQPNHGVAECGLKQGMTMKHAFIYWGLFVLSKVRNFVLTWEVLWWLFQKAWHIVIFFPVSKHLLTCPRKWYRHVDHFVENQICFSASLSVDMNFKLHFISCYQKLPHMIQVSLPHL